MHPTSNAALARGCLASGGGLRRALQPCPFEQRHWLHHAERHARRASAGNLCRTKSEAAKGQRTTPSPCRPVALLAVERVLAVLCFRELARHSLLPPDLPSGPLRMTSKMLIPFLEVTIDSLPGS